MANNFYVGYFLPGVEYTQVFPMESLTLDDAILELKNNINDLLFIGASNINICDKHGVIVFRY